MESINLYIFVFGSMVEKKLNNWFTPTQIEALGYYAPVSQYEELCKRKIFEHVKVAGKPISDMYCFTPVFFCQIMKYRRQIELVEKKEIDNKFEIMMFKIFITIVLTILILAFTFIDF